MLSAVEDDFVASVDLSDLLEQLNDAPAKVLATVALVDDDVLDVPNDAHVVDKLLLYDH